MTAAPTYLVTGPTRGLGLCLVRALSRLSAPPALVLLGRSGAALQAAADEATHAGAAEVEVVACDLGSLAQVRAAAEQIVHHVTQGSGRQLDGVVANAALQMSNATSVTEDGLEVTAGVGVVAHHLLLRSIQPVLAPGAHLVLIGSGTHYGSFPATLLVPGPRWEGAAKFIEPSTGPDASSLKAGRERYATSKLAVNYLCHEWNRRFGATLRANVYDPGLMPGTGLARDASRVQRFAWRTLLPALRILPGVTSPAHSADCLAALLVGEIAPGGRDLYFEIARQKPASAESHDVAREQELFDLLDERVQGFMPSDLGKGTFPR